MFLFKRIEDFQKIRTFWRSEGLEVGFVPTMGALHQGHLELVKHSRAFNRKTVVSIFVNPTQFNDDKDLEKYPRTPGQDILQLYHIGCDALFMPEINEVYPPATPRQVAIDLGYLDKVMEGAFRPGHFAGVAQVVDRLLAIVEPQRLYMGQKDYQQLAVIRRLLQQTNRSTELVMVPTYREKDGLAMSSRNVRLSPYFREKAPVIYRTLQAAGEAWKQGVRLPDIQKQALQMMKAEALEPEYFEIVNADTLLPPGTESRTAEAVVACTAAWAGEVRLIDNLLVS